MAMPNRPKDVKPKAEMPAGGGGGGGASMDATKIIIVNTITTLVLFLIFIGANYFLQDSLLTNKLAHISIGSGHEEGEIDMEEEDHGPQRGIILDLGDFILNLSDIKPRRYLKINVAIELSRKDSDPDPHAKPAGGGGHGHGAEPVDPMKQIEQEMNQFKPAIRDAVISTLSNKTSEELSSIAGKELSKEQIKEAVDAIFAEERETLRVSFGNFIIQ